MRIFGHTLWHILSYIPLMIRSTVFNFIMYLWTLIICGLASPALLLLRKPWYASFVTHVWSGGIRIALRVICGIRVNVVGKENLTKKPFVIACAHQSSWETIFFLSYFHNAIYVLKKEVTKIPFVGWYPKASGMCIIEREDSVSAMFKVIKLVIKRLDEGRNVIIFPEGTRIKPGDKAPYKLGVAAVYQRCKGKYNIIPTSLNSGMLWGRNAWLKRPGTITLKFFPPLPDNLGRDEMLTMLKTIVDKGNEDLEHV